MRTGSDATTPSLDERGMRAWHIAILIALLGTVFAVVVYFSTRHNDYPVYFHANSGPQTWEIRHGGHNFKQPLLLVVTTKAAWVIAGMPGGSQAVGELGNWVAATLGGLAAVNLTLLAFMLRGWLGAVCVGAIVSLCSPLMYYGHFFKEDTALVFGLTAVLLALAWLDRRRTLRAVALVGAACGLAFAGKYVGLLATALALPVVLLIDVRERADETNKASIDVDERRETGDATKSTLPRARRLKWFLTAFFMTVIIANYPAIFDVKDFFEGILYEVVHASEGQSDHGYVTLDRAKPLEQYVKYAGYEMPWLVTGLAGVGLALMLARWKDHGRIERLIALFAIGFFLVVTQSKVQQSRHFLPTWLLLHFMAGMAIVHLVLWNALGRVVPWAIAVVMLAPIMYVESRMINDRLSEFPRDSRYLMAQWIESNLPVEARIAADTTCGLPDPEWEYHDDERRRLPQEVVTGKYAPDLGTIDELIEQGFTHVAVSRKRIHQVSSDRRIPLPREVDRHEHRSTFYTELPQRGQLVWESHTEGTIAPKGGFSGEKLMLFVIAPIRTASELDEESGLSGADDTQKSP